MAPPLPPEVPGRLLTDACRQAVGGPADDGLGATLVGEIAAPIERPRRALHAGAGDVAAIGTPWARTPLRTALETGRGAANTRGDALAAFAEAGGDPAVTARVLAIWAHRSKGSDECVDNAIVVALGKSPRVRAAGAEVLVTVHEGKRCGSRRARLRLRSFDRPPPDVAKVCARIRRVRRTGGENATSAPATSHLRDRDRPRGRRGHGCHGLETRGRLPHPARRPRGRGGFSLGYTAVVTGACDGPMCA